MRKNSFIEISTPEIVKHNIVNLGNLVFEVTDACNLRCKYCGFGELYGGYDVRNNQYASFDMAKSLIDFMANIWRENIYEDIIQPLNIGFYGGEPLLNMKFIKKVVQYVNDLHIVNKPITFSMTTNAMLLDKYMEFLVENKFRIMISLDGDELGHSYRVDCEGANSYQRVVGNVRKLKDMHLDYFKNNVKFNAVLHNRNSVESIYYSIFNEFNIKPIISELNNIDVKREKKAEFDDMFRNTTQSVNESEHCEELTKDLFTEIPYTMAIARYIRYKTDNMYGNYKDLLISKDSIKYGQTGTCTPFMNKMFVTVTGKILSCEKINHKYAMGSVSSDHVDLDYQKIAQKQSDCLDRIKKQCITCVRGYECPLCVYNIEDGKCKYYNKDNYQRDEKELFLNALRDKPELYNEIMENVTIG